jgi:hypothetical protein
MTPPEPECTSREPEKRRLWPNGDSLSDPDKRLARVARCTMGYFRRTEIIVRL